MVGFKKRVTSRKRKKEGGFKTDKKEGELQKRRKAGRVSIKEGQL